MNSNLEEDTGKPRKVGIWHGVATVAGPGIR